MWTTRCFPRGARGACAAALALALAACGGDASTGVTPTDQVGSSAELGFLLAVGDAPTLANPTLSFWAKRGRDDERAIYYRPRAGRTDSTEFLRFRLDGRSLARRPDGTAFAAGDSVLITITVTDAAQLVASFQPAGLRFEAGREARLRFRLVETREDRDGDGDHDASDDAILAQLAIWRQETASSPWEELPSAYASASDEIEARLPGFTNYAVAYRKAR